MRIFYKKRFEKEFKKLPTKIQNQFYKRLGLFLKNKFDSTLNNHSVDRAFPDCRSINVSGDYRAIFQDQEDIATFITIGSSYPY